MNARAQAANAHPTATGFLNNLQALRAYAALSVVVLHLFQAWGVRAPFGSYGVDVFFVLSGYLMTRIADSDPSHFLARRVIRIVPIYWLCTLALFGVSLVAPNLLKATRADIWDLVRSLCFVPYHRENQVVQPFLYLGWTLNYEMYFYVLYAAAIRLSRARAAWITMALVSLPVVVRNVWHPDAMFWQFYGSQIVLEFVFGILVYQALRLPRWTGGPALKLGCLVLCLLLLPCLDAATFSAGNLFVFGGPESLYGRLSRLMVLGVPSLFIVFFTVGLETQGWRIRQRTALLVGDASYILYLIHPYVLGVGVKLTRFDHVNNLGVRIVLSLVLLAMAVAVSCLLHLYLEKPIQRLLHHRFLPKSKRPVAPGKAATRTDLPAQEAANTTAN